MPKTVFPTGGICDKNVNYREKREGKKGADTGLPGVQMTQIKLAYSTVAKGEQGTQRPMHAQRRAERFFRSRILRDLKDQFLEFMNDGFSAQLIDEKTKRLVDDLTGSSGVRLDRLGSIRFFVEQENLFRDISEILRKLPQKDRIADLLASADMTRRYVIALALRPPGAELMGANSPRHDPVTTSIIMDVMARWLTCARQRRKVLCDILSELDAREGTGLEEYSRLPETLNDISLNVDTYRELEGIIEDVMNKLLPRQEAKPVAKRWFWEKVIVQGIELINDYCHGEACPPDCRHIHEEACDAAAAILGLIYPDRFPGSLEETVAEIMERYLQIRHPANNEDAFIRNLFSRYLDEEPETVDPSQDRVG